MMRIPNQPIDEREQQLTDQIAAILSHPPHRFPSARTSLSKPTCAHTIAIDNDTGIDNEPEISTDRSIRAELETAQRSASHNNDDPKSATELKCDLKKSTLVRTTRRARFREGVSQVGSWVISLATIAFVTAVVSIILLGLPSQLDPSQWTAANTHTTANATTISTSVVRTQNIQPD